jgi:hypothetical protein
MKYLPSKLQRRRKGVVVHDGIQRRNGGGGFQWMRRWWLLVVALRIFEFIMLIWHSKSIIGFFKKFLLTKNNPMVS